MRSAGIQTSLYLYRPSTDYVTGRHEQAWRMTCNTAGQWPRAVRTAGTVLGARPYPAWFWTIGSIGVGLIITVTYIAFLAYGLPPLAVQLFRYSSSITILITFVLPPNL